MQFAKVTYRRSSPRSTCWRYSPSPGSAKKCGESRRSILRSASARPDRAPQTTCTADNPPQTSWCHSSIPDSIISCSTFSSPRRDRIPVPCLRSSWGWYRWERSGSKNRGYPGICRAASEKENAISDWSGSVPDGRGCWAGDWTADARACLVAAACICPIILSVPE